MRHNSKQRQERPDDFYWLVLMSLRELHGDTYPVMLRKKRDALHEPIRQDKAKKEARGLNSKEEKRRGPA